MFERITFRVLVGTILLGFSGLVCWERPDNALSAQEKKEKNPLEGKKGKVVGLLTEKGPNFIDVKADGEEKARRYVPEWKGGNPNQGGGPDKAMLKTIAGLKVGSRVEVDWHFEERFRVIAVKVLKAPSVK